MLIIILAIALIAGMASLAACHFNRERKSPVDLDGDWWTDFEAQFRAYAAQQTSHHRRLES